MKTPIKLKGIVTEEVIQTDNQSKYKIKSNGKEYSILSTGRQAAKDNLFIRKGQHMEIEGKEDLVGNSRKQVISEKSKILLRQGVEK